MYPLSLIQFHLISFSKLTVLTVYRDLGHSLVLPNVASLEPPKPKGFKLSHFNFFL
jgi:hypothetical protein